MCVVPGKASLDANHQWRLETGCILVASLLFALITLQCDANPTLALPQSESASLSQTQQQRMIRSLQLQQNTSAAAAAGAQSSEAPSYIAIGKKISKILNDFFDVSTTQLSQLASPIVGPFKTG